MNPKMSEARKVIRVYLATSHPFGAYGDTQSMNDDELEDIALRVRENRLPLNVGHDLMRPLNERFISVNVVDLDDGFKAVVAEVEVDGEIWDIYDGQREASGASGGLSITVARYFAQLTGQSHSFSANNVSVTGDASHFTKSDLISAGAGLKPLGTVQVGLLYQFADVPSCRIVIDFVQQAQAPGLLSEGIAIATGAIGSLISVAILKLMSKAKRTTILTDNESHEGSGTTDPLQTQIEVIVRHQSDGTVTKVLQVRTDSAEVVDHAFLVFENALADDATRLIWNDERQKWTEPSGKSDE
jgi:hypothetical protein